MKRLIWSILVVWVLPNVAIASTLPSVPWWTINVDRTNYFRYWPSIYNAGACCRTIPVNITSGTPASGWGDTGNSSFDGAAEFAASGLNSFSRAGEFGIKPYNVLRRELKGMGLHAHHLIERRFAETLGRNWRTMESIALTPAEHQVFTNAWKDEIALGVGTRTATPERIMQAAKRIYANYPEILGALGF